MKCNGHLFLVGRWVCQKRRCAVAVWISQLLTFVLFGAMRSLLVKLAGEPGRAGQTPPAPSSLQKHICSRLILPRAASENQRELMQCWTQGCRRKWKGWVSCLTPGHPLPPLTTTLMALNLVCFLSRLPLCLTSTSTNLIGIRSLCANSRSGSI